MDLINDIGPIEMKDGVYEVQTLLDRLIQKNRFLSKDQFTELVSNKKLRMGNPYNFGFVEKINGRTTMWYKESKKYTLKKRKDYWNYVKKCLFGDFYSANNTRGLMNINNLTEEDIKEIVELICSDLASNGVTVSFFLRVRGVGVIDKEDIFCPQNKNVLIDDLLEYKNLFISVENDIEEQEAKTDLVLECYIEKQEVETDLVPENNTGKMENENLKSAISLLNDKEVNNQVDILKNSIKDSDLCTFEIGVYLLRFIKDKKRICQNNLEKQSYDEQIVKLNSCEESVLYGLYSTDTFYDKRNMAYHECLKNIKTDKHNVSVEQIIATAKEICSSNEKAKDIYLDIFSRNDYLAEMEDDLKKENSVAQMLSEMIDILYKLQEKWGISGENINSHRLDKKIILQTDKDKGTITDEFVKAQEQHQKIAFAKLDEDTRKALLEARGEAMPGADTLINREDIAKLHFADISRILQQFRKLVIFKKYLLGNYEKDAADQKEAILRNKLESKEKYYELYHTGRNSLLYLTKFVDHNNSQGAASVKTTLEAFYALIPKVYQYLKTKNSDDAWFEFLDKLDGICLEACCSNITDYCEKHSEIIDICINKERKHSGIYIHKVLDLKYCFSTYDVACKVIMQLMDDYDRKGNKFFWDEVKDEIAYYVAERKWSDADFRYETEKELVNSKEFEELKIKLEESFVIQKNDKINNQPSENKELVNSKEFEELKIKLEESFVIQKNDKINNQPSENKELVNSKEFEELKIKLEESFVIQKNDKINNQPSENIGYMLPQASQIKDENCDMVSILLNKYNSANALFNDKDFDVKKIGEYLADVKDVKVGWGSWFKIFFSSLGVCIRNLFNKNFKFSVYAKLVIFYEGKQTAKYDPEVLDNSNDLPRKKSILKIRYSKTVPVKLGQIDNRNNSEPQINNI